MLLGRVKEPPTSLLTSIGGGPCKGEKPASKGTGQATAWPHTARHRYALAQWITIGFALWRYRALDNIWVLTPGRGIDHDGRTLARGFRDGNLLWRGCLQVWDGNSPAPRLYLHIVSGYCGYVASRKSYSSMRTVNLSRLRAIWGAAPRSVIFQAKYPWLALAKGAA